MGLRSQYFVLWNIFDPGSQRIWRLVSVFRFVPCVQRFSLNFSVISIIDKKISNLSNWFIICSIICHTVFNTVENPSLSLFLKVSTPLGCSPNKVLETKLVLRPQQVFFFFLRLKHIFKIIIRPISRCLPTLMLFSVPFSSLVLVHLYSSPVLCPICQQYRVVVMDDVRDHLWAKWAAIALRSRHFFHRSHFPSNALNYHYYEIHKKLNLPRSWFILHLHI